MTLAEFLRASGLSQRALARRLDVSDSTVSKWLHGRILPDARRLAELERLSGGQVTAADFLQANAGQGLPPVPSRPVAGLAEAQSLSLSDTQDTLLARSRASVQDEAKALGLDTE